MSVTLVPSFFFFNDTATTEIYTLSLHDALPISKSHWLPVASSHAASVSKRERRWRTRDRESTRLKSSHPNISYGGFCFKKKKKKKRSTNGLRHNNRLPVVTTESG